MLDKNWAKHSHFYFPLRKFRTKATVVASRKTESSDMKSLFSSVICQPDCWSTKYILLLDSSVPNTRSIRQTLSYNYSVQWWNDCLQDCFLLQNDFSSLFTCAKDCDWVIEIILTQLSWLLVKIIIIIGYNCNFFIDSKFLGQYLFLNSYCYLYA